VVAGWLLVATRIAYLADLLSVPVHPAHRVVSEVLNLVGALTLVAAFAVSQGGFRRPARSERLRTLAIAAGLFASYGAARFLGVLVELANTPSGSPWKSTAAQALSGGGDFSLLLAAVVVGVGLLSGRQGRVLGWACFVLAGHYALTTTALGFSLSEAYDYFAVTPGRFVGYVIASGVGYFVAALAAVKAASAFATGGERRDRELGVAAILFVVAFLTVAGGVIAVASHGTGPRDWLNAAGFLALAAAAAVGVVAFFSSEQRDGSDVAVLTDQG